MTEQQDHQPQDETAGSEPLEQSAVDEIKAETGENIESLKQRLEEVEKSLAEADIRAQAEIQNIRRRAEREVANAHKYALEKFAADILGVADSLERGLKSLDPEDESLRPAREGLELTLKVLLDVFARFNIQQLNPLENPFNPEQHEAMAMVPHPELPANTVMEVLEKGYTLNDRLIRPARVVVSKGQE